MKVIKIGGGCLKGKKNIGHILELIIKHGRGHIFVVSALNGITDFLIDSMDIALSDEKEIPAIISRLKIMSSLDIAERRLPQDGRIKLKIGKNREMDFRVSCLPTLFGEKIVLRLLDKSNLQLDMTKLGYEEQALSFFKQEIHKPFGMVLVTGPTGSGKSTTLAAMVDYINTSRAHHILTVEDPIEFIHPIKRGVVNQRQLERDTLSYGNALKGALREDPDVIMIGELRDLATISLAISAAETGHLVIGTLATSNAPKTIDRIIDAYPPDEQNQIRTMLGESLKAVLSQRLIPGTDGTSMMLACEVMIGTLSLTNLIRDGKTFQIPSIMQTGKSAGMQIMDDSIMALLQEGKISASEAYANAAKPEKFKTFVEKEAKKNQEAQAA